MGQCLRGKMVEVGLIPAPPAPAVAEVEAPTDEVVANLDEAVTPEPELDVTPTADTEVETEIDQVVAATFGLLRAEPDGSVVIAGSGTPGSRVEVFANGELLGTVEVETSGDWVFVPDTPLPPGGLEITLGEEGKAGRAEDSFIVVINENKTSQPLVVASKPGEASEVLQGLTAPAQVAAAPQTSTSAPAEQPASPETPVAAAAPAATPETAVAETPDAAPAEQPASPETPLAAAAPATTPETAVAETPDAAPADTATMQVASAPEPATPPPATETAPAVAPAEPEAEVTPPEVPTDAVVPAAPATTQAPDATGSSEAVPASELAEPVPAELSVQPAQAPPTIDAIEIENDRTFFAGSGPEGGTVRLYVDDEFVADATVESGRWLIEAGPVLDAPSQRVRVDLLEPGSANVAARAEVDFVVDVPAVQEPVVVAEAPAAAAPEATGPAEIEAESAAEEPSPVVQAAPAPPALPQPSAAPAEAPAAAPPTTTEPIAEPPASAAEPAPATEAVPVDPAPATEVVPVDPAPEPATEPAVVAEAVPAPAAEPEQPVVPTMVAVSLGDPEAQRFVSGKAIIRRGDNLWTIARRVYGEGLKYTTIYQANTGQIRDPDRIYPGQVFDLPDELSGQ